MNNVVCKKRIFKLMIYITIISMIYIICVNNIFAVNYLYDINNKDETEEKSTFKEDESSISTNAKPILTIQEAQFSFESVSQILIEPTTNTVLYENNADEKLLPASVTKVMTLLLTMEQIDSGKLNYDDRITCSANASKMGGSQIWFKENESLSVDEALKAICVVSANDVTVSMAEHIAGSEENFVKMMNDKAKELGMENTSFKNCHGIDEEGHYTTARDIAIMSRELIVKHPDILKYTSIWMDSLRDGAFGLTNTNKLIRFYNGAVGLKTGYTSNAGYNLSAVATRDNTTYLTVVMKAPSSDVRMQEVKQLLDYAFANYSIQNIYSKSNVVEEINLNKSLNKVLSVGIKEDVTVLKNKGTSVEISTNAKYNDNLIAPIQKDSIVGKLEIINKITNEIIDEKDLIALNNVERASFKDYIKELAEILFIKM